MEDFKYYQFHQHFHHFFCNKVLGVIQQDIPMVSIQGQAVKNQEVVKLHIPEGDCFKDDNGVNA